MVTRGLQNGDPDGALRRALGRFPFPAMARAMIERHFIPGGSPPGEVSPAADALAPLSRDHEAYLVASSFAYVSLAKEGHDNPVGINLLEKAQMFTLPVLYGAMLAGVGFVLMGAGVPRSIPGALDRMARGEAAALALHVEDEVPGQEATTGFDPASFCGVRRPCWSARGSWRSSPRHRWRRCSCGSRTAAWMASSSRDTPRAGTTPRRGGSRAGGGDEPVYGDRDIPDLAAMRPSGSRSGWRAPMERGRPPSRPAGRGAGDPGGNRLCVLRGVGDPSRPQAAGPRGEPSRQARVRTDSHASPTGFPFKIVSLEGTLSRRRLRGAKPPL